ncbi:MAG TPA: hypothetical protein VKU19_37150 [Bryobacteraceae bacterium]|nr:hypothetical protein [Bryobacteraceae bacterium]
MLAAQTNTTLVGRLLIRSRAADPQLEQQRIHRMLRAATLHPASLPDSSLLIVRQLADPLPSRLRAGPFDAEPDRAWQRAFADKLEALRASAASPAFGPVPTTAAAVLFHDRAEQLAALALDWLAGNLSSHWWWRELLRGQDLITAVLREWIGAPQYVPGALEILARQNRVLPFTQRLPRQVAAEILEAVLQTHGIPRTAIDDGEPETGSASNPPGTSPPFPKSAAIVPVDRSANSTRVSQPEAHAVGARPVDRRPAPAAGIRPPWIAWVPEASSPALSPIQTELLVQGLMLRRSPATVRTITFQKALLRYQSAPGSEQIRPPRPEASPAAKPEKSVPKQGASPASPETAPEQKFASESSAPFPEDRTAEPPSAANQPVAVPPQTPAHSQGSNADAPLATQQSSPPAPAAAETHAPAPQTLDDRQSADLPAEPAAQASRTIETAFGGIFFLLNVALYLGIYGDFTNPIETGIELNIWDFLSLMAADLLGREVEDDPLWDLLASLAARPPAARPGLSFDPPEEWRLPDQWLEPFSEDYDPQPVLSDGRMITRHPAGFAVLDLAAGPQQPVDRLQRWVTWMAQYMRARLVRSLGREDALPLLCRSRARITVTMTHVEIRFCLDLHPIEVRMAGLDRDPGWIPAAGRYVAYHFE